MKPLTAGQHSLGTRSIASIIEDFIRISQNPSAHDTLVISSIHLRWQVLVPDAFLDFLDENNSLDDSNFQTETQNTRMTTLHKAKQKVQVT